MGADEIYEEAKRLVEQAGVLRRGSDLDLLVFFARHPRALLTSEQIATFLGYDINQIAESLELLLESRLVTRTQNPNHAARLYVLTSGHESGGWLPGLLEFSASRKGRLALLTALTERRTREPADPVARSTNVRALRSVRG